MRWRIVFYDYGQTMSQSEIEAPTAEDALTIHRVRVASAKCGSSGPLVGDVADIEHVPEPVACEGGR